MKFYVTVHEHSSFPSYPQPFPVTALLNLNFTELLSLKEKKHIQGCIFHEM